MQQKTECPPSRLSRRSDSKRREKAPVRRKTIGILSAMAGAVTLLAASFVARQPAYVWNFTPSVPTGLYRLDKSAWARGDLVVVRPSGLARELLGAFDALKAGRVLIKRIAGVPGDIVCRFGAEITIRGKIVARARSQTQSGRLLPAWAGCAPISSDSVFLLADHPDSFDGRYFGLTRSVDIVGVAHPIATPSIPHRRVP